MTVIAKHMHIFAGFSTNYVRNTTRGTHAYVYNRLRYLFRKNNSLISTVKTMHDYVSTFLEIIIFEHIYK